MAGQEFWDLLDEPPEEDEIFTGCVALDEDEYIDVAWGECE